MHLRPRAPHRLQKNPPLAEEVEEVMADLVWEVAEEEEVVVVEVLRQQEEVEEVEEVVAEAAELHPLVLAS